MFNKTLINKPVTSSIKEAALSSSLRTVIIFVRTIESFMFHGAMALRADQRELHSSCSAPHSAFASARLMALRRLVVGRALFFQPASIFPDVWFTSMAGFLIHFSRCARRTTNGPIFPTCEFTCSGFASENVKFRALRNTLPKL